MVGNLFPRISSVSNGGGNANTKLTSSHCAGSACSLTVRDEAATSKTPFTKRRDAASALPI